MSPSPNDREWELGRELAVAPEVLARYREEVCAPLRQLTKHWREAAARRVTESGFLELTADAVDARLPKDGEGE